MNLFLAQRAQRSHRGHTEVVDTTIVGTQIILFQYINSTSSKEVILLDQGYEKYRKFFHDKDCPANICEDILIGVPVVVRANAEVNDVDFKCMGHTIIKNTFDAPGKPNAINKFVVCQKISLHIPINFMAECEIGEGSVDFDMRDCMCE